MISFKRAECNVLFLLVLVSVFSFEACDGGGGSGAAVDPAQSYLCSGQGWDSTFDDAVYLLPDPLCLGDDTYYNFDHEPDFLINAPSGISYAESFEVPNACQFSRAAIQHTVAGAVRSPSFFLNDVLVGHGCNPGNTADAVKTCPDIDITGGLDHGSNTLKVSTVLFPGDESRPYDDIEIYQLRITLTK